eukprot:1162005-Pelagomonas_calceolata.AAC.4
MLLLSVSPAVTLFFTAYPCDTTVILCPAPACNLRLPAPCTSTTVCDALPLQPRTFRAICNFCRGIALHCPCNLRLSASRDSVPCPPLATSGLPRPSPAVRALRCTCAAWCATSVGRSSRAWCPLGIGA